MPKKVEFTPSGAASSGLKRSAGPPGSGCPRRIEVDRHLAAAGAERIDVDDTRRRGDAAAALDLTEEDGRDRGHARRGGMTVDLGGVEDVGIERVVVRGLGN